MLAGLCLFTLGIRLIDLTQPALDLQAWRQADTAAVARNYYEEGFHFLYPRVDWRGDTPGYVEMEFPFYQFVVACLYALAGGPREWVGHAVSAMFSVASVPLVYGLARQLYGLTAARCAALMFAVAPLNAFYGRAFMPDATMLFFSVGAIYFFARWTENGRTLDFAVATVCAMLALLLKLPSLYLALPLLALSAERFGWGLIRQGKLWAFVVLTLAPTVLWYLHAYRLFEETHLTFGILNRYGFVKFGGLRPLVSPEFYTHMLGRLAGVAFTPVGFVTMLAGALMKVRSRKERFVHVWLLALIIYVLVISEGNRQLNYYQLPFIPVGALFVGKALGRLWEGRTSETRGSTSWGPRQLAVVGLLLVICGLSYSYASTLFVTQPYYRAQFEIGRDVDALIPKDALLVVGDIDDNRAPYRTQAPMLLYFCHRKGWQLLPDEFQDTQLLSNLAERGARFFLVPIRMIYLLNQAYVSMVLKDVNGTEIRRFDKRYLTTKPDDTAPAKSRRGG